MKKLGILLLACITALNLWAEEIKIGKLTFEIKTPTTVELHDADEDIENVFLSETIGYLWQHQETDGVKQTWNVVRTR